MSPFQGVEENFRFIVLEVTKQIEDTLKVIENPSASLKKKIDARDDYIDNLKSIIENKCFFRLNASEIDKKTIGYMRSISNVSNNMEHISDYSVNIVRQTEYFTDPNFIKNYNYKAFFDEALGAMALVTEAVLNKDINLALKISRAEFALDKLCKENLHRILGELKEGGPPENLLTTIFIFRYLERMGDALLNIGEAVISSVVGEKLKIGQFKAIEATLMQNDPEHQNFGFVFEAIGETRSGCKIGRVYDKDSDGDAHEVIFKQGRSEKLSKEKRNIEHWESIIHGLPPKVFAFTEQGRSATLVTQYIGGNTFQDILIKGDSTALSDSLSVIQDTAREIWNKTFKPHPLRPGYIDQIRARLEDVFTVHPEFMRDEKKTIGRLEAAPLLELIDKAKQINDLVEAPFQVYIHGDFNIDNVIFNKAEQKAHFIDLHRSCYMDYIQDLSVFMVSNFRVPVFDAVVRNRINWVIEEMNYFGKSFAEEKEDHTYDMRLAFGLIRSFITSTRFVLDKEFAKELYLRANYLLDKVVNHSGEEPKSFLLPQEVLRY